MRKYKRRILAALCCFLAAACSLSAIPFFRGQSEQMPPGGYAVAAVFWGSLLLGLGLSLTASLGFGKYRRRAENRGLIKRSRVPGVFRFRREHWLLQNAQAGECPQQKKEECQRLKLGQV